jgi:hypothetical protein
MAKRKRYNPERHDWKGLSYKKHGERILERKFHQKDRDMNLDKDPV